MRWEPVTAVSIFRSVTLHITITPADTELTSIQTEPTRFPTSHQLTTLPSPKRVGKHQSSENAASRVPAAPQT
jgi:hypothetical protein